MILKAMDDMGLKNPYVWQCQIPDSTLSEGKDKMVWFVTGTQLCVITKENTWLEQIEFTLIYKPSFKFEIKSRSTASVRLAAYALWC